MGQLLKGFKKVYFVGIGGYGMSALALVLLKAGLDVRGSDIKSSRLTEILEKAGARVFIGHQAEQLEDAELVVYSTAIPPHNPELKAARERGVPIWHRSELLAAILNTGWGIAIAGAHGKTTTTAMVSLLLERGGLSPTAIIGGEVSFYQGNASLGGGKFIVAEACESDSSFLRYIPYIALVTNIEADHLEYYDGNFEKLVETYRGFLNNVREGGVAVLCADDPVLRELKGKLPCRVLTYGFSEEAEIRGGDVELKGMGSTVRVFQQGRPLGELSLKIPGQHNVLNALGATAVALLLGVDFVTVSKALAAFEGARRRFEIVGEKRGVMVVDDYAHHPTEIMATLRAARQSGRRIICVFQPHRYTRTFFLWNDFLEAFAGADLLVLDEIYSAGEEPIAGVTSRALANEISKRGYPVRVIQDREEMLRFLEKNTRLGDMVITMGAGNIWQVGREFVRRA